MIDGNTPVSSVKVATVSGENELYMGLTKREYFAAKAMEGFIAAWGQHDLVAADEIAHDSVLLADALINELNK